LIPGKKNRNLDRKCSKNKFRKGVGRQKRKNKHISEKKWLGKKRCGESRAKKTCQKVQGTSRKNPGPNWVPRPELPGEGGGKSRPRVTHKIQTTRTENG